MNKNDFSTALLVDQTPEEVFNAVTNVRGWWSGLFAESFEGNTEKLHDEFSFYAGEGAHYSKQKLVEVVPNEKVVWLVTDGALTFVEKQDEWIGTKVIFNIAKKGDKTQLIFTHEGLTPEIECYDSCAPAWTQYVQTKLLSLITGNNQ
ncbi:MAG: SRPBCC domain-containing protein [Flavipsychrobacter sp.]|nr:SRPBCC domain-containing protein [Flavipsychrobacter sp.]